MLIRVAVPVPTLDLLTYVVPPDMAAPVVGARVVVPVSGRSLTGIVVEADAAQDATLDGKALKSISDVLDDEPFVPQDVVDLARWTAEYLRGRRRRGDHGGAPAEGTRRARRRAQDDPRRVDHGGGSRDGRCRA